MTSATQSQMKHDQLEDQAMPTGIYIMLDSLAFISQKQQTMCEMPLQ